MTATRNEQETLDLMIRNENAAWDLYKHYSVSLAWRVQYGFSHYVEETYHLSVDEDFETPETKLSGALYSQYRLGHVQAMNGFEPISADEVMTIPGQTVRLVEMRVVRS